MFQRCSIAKNAIRFSFSHSLTSLFCCTFFFFVPRNLRGSHFATLACLHSPCTYNLCLLHLYSYILSFHPFPSALPPPCFSSSIKLPFSLHPSHLCLSSFPSSASSPFLLSGPRLASLSLSLSSLTEVARSADMVFARRESQDVFLPDGPGQPAPTPSPQAPPPTYPQSVSPLHK